MPTPNVDHIRKTVALIEANPEHFNMGDYVGTNTRCETTFCLAGWACAVDKGEDAVVSAWYNGGWQLDTLARKLLGLTQNQAEDLFFRTWIKTVDELKEAIAEVTGVTFEEAG